MRYYLAISFYLQYIQLYQMNMEAIRAIKKCINNLKRRYIGYQEIIYNSYLNIPRFLLLITKTQLEYFFN